jgi:DNA-binding NtrC family response regulator
MNKVLVVDDQQILRVTLTELLEESGFSVTAVASGSKAIEIFKNDRPSAVLLDLKMPDMDGIETMQELKKIDADVPVILVTAYGDIETAVEAIKLGAYDFIVKPPKFDRLIFTLKRAIGEFELKKKVENLNIAFETSLEWLLGSSDSIKKIIKQIHQVAWSDFSLIIQGETGTGKTTIARAIHNLSKRAKGPFVIVDIGAMPDTLIESELFGYEKGAFTGADRKKKGFFEIAEGGTILIDDLENISPLIQGKLLRAVEERRIYPLGSIRPVDIDVRIIAATNTDIGQSVKEKKFREDLFFRLGEFMIRLPSLRDRSEDIPHLAKRFTMETAREMNKRIGDISDDALSLLIKYPWPGNVRELRNVIRRAVLLADGNTIMPEHIEFLIGDKCGSDVDKFTLMPLKELSAMAVRDVEKKAIKQALSITKGNKTRAASILQIDYKTLLTKIKEYEIS